MLSKHIAFLLSSIFAVDYFCLLFQDKFFVHSYEKTESTFISWKCLKNQSSTCKYKIDNEVKFFKTVSVDEKKNSFKHSNSQMFNNDPEIHMNASQLILSKGLPCEVHYVKTSDGFILGMQRIPHPSRNQLPILLMHGLLSSSDCFLTNLINESLAYILYNKGYDVWLGNVRGNTYSRRHVTLTPNEKEFWEWTFDEMGQFDIPAIVDYVLKISNHSQLYYIGHSQGTTVLFAAAIAHGHTFSKKIYKFIALAPAGIIDHMTSPLHYLCPIANDIVLAYDIFGAGEFLPRQGLIEKVADIFCPLDPKICENVLFLIAGSDLTNTNRSRVPVYTSHNPAGTSVRNMLHWAQLYKSKTMVYYDYGSYIANMLHYGSIHPPSYDLSKFAINTVVFCGGKDSLVVLKDCEYLLTLLNNVEKATVIPIYTHLDFVWALNAKFLIYDNILHIIKSL